MLFLDRGDARARAYIDRARTALAERQRRADELLHTSRAARRRRHRARARSAGRGRGHDRRRRTRGRDATAPRASRARQPAWPDGTERRIDKRTLVAPVAGLMPSGRSSRPWPPSRCWWWWPARRDCSPARRRPDAGAARRRRRRRRPSALRRAPKSRLIRARTRVRTGRLAEALRALDRVDAQSPARAEADALRDQHSATASGQWPGSGARRT